MPHDPLVKTPVTTEAAPQPEPFWNVPNALSLSRLGLTAVALVEVERADYLGAFVLFLIAALTDFFDGYLARLLNQATVLGRQLDPLVDKVMVLALYVELLTIPNTGVNSWVVNIIMARELLIQGLRSLLEGQGQAFGAKWAGKVKTFTQCCSIGAILLFLHLQPPPFWLWVRDTLTWSAVGLTIYSGWGYLLAGFRLISARPGNPNS